MTIKDTLAKRKESPTAIFHRFRTTNKSSYKYHLFVEGYEDLSLYSKYIERIDRETINNSKTHVCYGKKNMDKIISLFYESELTERKVLFIRDSDFDKFLGKAPTGPHVFLTCGYAVENYVCTELNISSYIRSTFGVDVDQVGVEEMCRNHSNRVFYLFDWLKEFFGAVLYANMNDKILDLNQIDARVYYATLYRGETLPTGIMNEWRLAGLSDEDFNDESRALGQKYTEQEAYTWLRGKYLLESACEFLKLEHRRLMNLHKGGQISQFNRKVNPDFSAASVFEKLSSHSQASEALQEALLRTLAA